MGESLGRHRSPSELAEAPVDLGIESRDTRPHLWSLFLLGGALRSRRSRAWKRSPSTGAVVHRLPADEEVPRGTSRDLRLGRHRQRPGRGAPGDGVEPGKRIIPTITFPDESLLVEPSDGEIALKLGLQLRADRMFFDLIVIGAGPAGLTASMYAAREGIDALVLMRAHLGGQAGVTERIDNYPGFLEGIKGADLAERIVARARRYEVTLLSAVGVTGLRREGPYVVVDTDQGDSCCAPRGAHRDRVLVPASRCPRRRRPDRCGHPLLRHL